MPDDAGTQSYLQLVGPPVFVHPPGEPPGTLEGRDRADWFVLSRVAAGAVSRYGGRLYDGNLPFPHDGLVSPLYLEVLHALRHVAVRAHAVCPSLEFVSLTDEGRARLAELEAQRNE